MRTTHRQTDTRGGASTTQQQQKRWASQRVHAPSPTAAGPAAPGPTPAGICGGSGVQTHGCWGGVHPATPPTAPAGAYHCYLSWRSALETGDRSFERRAAAHVCIPSSGVNMTRAHHRKTNKHRLLFLSFLYLFSSFPPQI